MRGNVSCVWGKLCEAGGRCLAHILQAPFDTASPRTSIAARRALLSIIASFQSRHVAAPRRLGGEGAAWRRSHDAQHGFTVFSLSSRVGTCHRQERGIGPRPRRRNPLLHAAAAQRTAQGSNPIPSRSSLRDTPRDTQTPSRGPAD